MRVLIAATAIAAMALLSGCDQEPVHQASAGASIQPPCNCKPGQTASTATGTGSTTTPAATGSQAAATAASAAHGATKAQGKTTRGGRHGHAWRMASYRHWSGRNWESRRVYSYGRRMRHAYAHDGEAPYNYVSRSRVYSHEGYGRHHGWHRHVTFAATMSGERLDPWHGYDVNCDRR